jgi:3-deoxy-D-manno-octulosonic-acid transferase
MNDLRRRAARASYSAVLAAAQPGYLLRLWWRGRKEPLYRLHLLERLGRYEDAPTRGWLWLHAVSLGETRAAAALIDVLRAVRPDVRILLTHGTATGREAGVPLMRTDLAADGTPWDRQVWLPYDSPAAARRFIAHFRPAVGVLIETEVWPNLLEQARREGVPMVLANARLSERSEAKGERFDALMRPAVESLALVLAQAEDDAERVRARGAAHVEVCGNLKFDVAPDAALVERGRRWRAQTGRPLVLAASTREGEEAMLLAAWRGVPQPRPRLLLVPRHPQRFDEAAMAAVQAGFTLARRSQWSDGPDGESLQCEVWLGDSLGEMPLYYGCADVALLGGSFAPLGGQNLIEAAACGCPVVMGPHTFNFAEAAELALGAGAAWRAADIAQAVSQAVALAHSPMRDRMAQRALQFAAKHRGAAQRMAERILKLMPR